MPKASGQEVINRLAFCSNSLSLSFAIGLLGAFGFTVNLRAESEGQTVAPEGNDIVRYFSP